MTRKTIRVLIADDEPLGRTNVRVALSHEPDVQIICECDTGDEAVRRIAEEKPDLVFLDVRMPGVDAFEVIERVGADNMPPVVFVTAHDTYAVRAFQVNALDFVLKPFDDARFGAVMTHVREQLETRNARELGRRLQEFLDDYHGLTGARADARSEEGQFITRFGVKEDGRMLFVRAVDVDLIVASGNYAKLHVKDKEYLVRCSLRALAPQLDPRRFLRVHKSSILNLDRVKEVQPWFGGDYVALLHDGRTVRVSRTYAPALIRPFQ